MRTAERTLSLASFSPVSGSPTIVTFGEPPPMSASISIILPSTPSNATDQALANAIQNAALICRTLGGASGRATIAMMS